MRKVLGGAWRAVKALRDLLLALMVIAVVIGVFIAASTPNPITFRAIFGVWASNPITLEQMDLVNAKLRQFQAQRDQAKRELAVFLSTRGITGQEVADGTADQSLRKLQDNVLRKGPDLDLAYRTAVWATRTDRWW